VNERKLFVAGEGSADANRRTSLLQMWLDAGLELGNHTYSHLDLNTVPLERFQADVLRGEAVTRGLMAAAGRRLQYFRHPFLHVGATLETRRAFESFLASHSHTMAPVTMDNDEFVYAAAYANALRAGDATGAARIADDYLRYMVEVFSFFEEVSLELSGRPVDANRRLALAAIRVQSSTNR
jgi:peptidoglycan/xylan/chitin deacetylase (PgdA/CDA1 family)